MIEKIGKYRILERIGSGGMGTVYKAHDPILDRTVALKVISADSLVSDELRTRLFREAQACARLSHQNVVTLYDLGDVEGRLFIVMEFLEGQELRQVIAERQPMSLEDKLGLMIQICDGLGYAHRQGIIHRDVKPGNILVQRNGRVKILDFGVARILSSEAGLTRTGLVVGTLRYMAPEQARGRADHRSDIFSAGAVFYELLGYRPAFPGVDPIEILEALRAFEPVPLTEIDRDIPPDLAAIIARALRKDPAERPLDLDELGRQLDGVRRRLVEEAERLRARLRVRVEEVHRLDARVTALAGQGTDGEIPAAVDAATGVLALQALERDLARRVERLERILEHAGALEPSVQRGLDLLEAGELEAAADQLEPIVAALPEHGRAADALRRARAALEERRQREELRRALEHARTALEQGDEVACVEQLERLEEGEVPPEIRSEIDRLREAAESARIAKEQRREAIRLERERAGREQDEARRARQAAEDLGSDGEASAPWGVAERRWTEGNAAFDAGDYVAAAEAFVAALEQYRTASHEARDARRRRAQAEVDAARSAAARARAAAVALDAADYAGDVWAGAVDTEAQAGAAVARQELATGVTLFVEAARMYERSAEIAQRERRREREAAERAREAMGSSRERAAQVGAPEHAPGTWGDAEGKRAAGERALGDAGHRRAAECFRQALELFDRAASESRARLASLPPAPALPSTADPAETRAVVWDESTRIQQIADATAMALPEVDTRVVPDAARHAAPVLQHEQTATSRPRRWWPLAAGMGGVALVAAVIYGVLPRTPAPHRLPPENPVVDSRPAENRPVDQRPLIEKLASQVEDVRKAAETAGVPALAPATFRRAGELQARGDAALADEKLDQARAQYAAALEAYEASTREASAERSRRAENEQNIKQQIADAEASRRSAGEARRTADAARAPRYAARSFGVGEELDRRGQVALGRKDYGAAASSFREAQPAYLKAKQEAEIALAAQQRDAERLRTQAKEVRREAEGVGADRYRPTLMAAGLAKERDGDAAMNQQDYERAAPQFRGAQTDFLAALQQAQGDIAAVQARQAALRQEIEQLRDTVVARRDEAARAEAKEGARGLFDAAQAQEKEGDRLLVSANLPEARAAYQEALKGYGLSVERARRLTDANRARARMQEEKQGARPDSSDFIAGLEQEKTGHAFYARAAFPEAAERFRSATDLFAKAKLPPLRPEPTPVSEADRIRAVLREFKRAVESKDLTLLQRVQPGLAGDELRRFQATFDNSGGYTLDLNIRTIKIDGNVAYANAYRTDTFSAKDGQIHRQETNTKFTFRRAQDRWTIEAIEAVR